MLGVPEQALNVLHEALEPVLAHGAVIDKGRALLLTARCQMAVAGFRPNRQGQAGNGLTPRRTLIPISPLQVVCSFTFTHCCLLSPQQIWIWQSWLLTRWTRPRLISPSWAVRSGCGTSTTCRLSSTDPWDKSHSATKVPCSSGCWTRSCSHQHHRSPCDSNCLLFKNKNVFVFFGLLKKTDHLL